MLNALLPISKQFINSATEISTLGNGLINDTYLVTSPSNSFVMQRVNRQVFPEPELILSNLTTLNRHVAQKPSTAVKLKLPEIIKSTSGSSFYHDELGNCWRALSFIENTESIETINTISEAEQVGFALGHFHRLTYDLDPKRLHDTLPGFHITPNYLKYYHRILQQPIALLNEASHYCANFIDQFQSIADELEVAVDQQLLSLRVIHGDPKLNNFLFDRSNGKCVSIIDLDTVKPGLVHYDIGDCLRSCCYRTNPDRFDLDICAAILNNYLNEAGELFTEADYRFLFAAIRLIPFELGIRFYTDYLEGNRYFKVIDPEQNLNRAAVQFNLCQSINNQETAIQKLITYLQAA